MLQKDHLIQNKAKQNQHINSSLLHMNGFKDLQSVSIEVP